jgi:hypothetical protein
VRRTRIMLNDILASWRERELHKKLTGPQLRLLLGFFLAADDYGVVHIDRASAPAHVGQSRKHFDLVLKELYELGVIEPDNNRESGIPVTSYQLLHPDHLGLGADPEPLDKEP